MMADRGPAPASAPKATSAPLLWLHAASRKPGEKERARLWPWKRKKGSAHAEGDALATVPGEAGTRSRTPGQKYAAHTAAVLPSRTAGKGDSLQNKQPKVKTTKQSSDIQKK